MEQPTDRRLYREPDDRRLAGVCSGLADFLGLDPTVVRLLAVSLVLLAGAGIALYLVAAIVIPQRPTSTPRVRAEHFSATDVTTPPMLALLVLALSLVAVLDRDWFPGPPVGIALLVLGVWLLAKNSRPDHNTRSGEPTTVTGSAAAEGDISPDETLLQRPIPPGPTDPATNPGAHSAGPQGEVPPPVPPWGFGAAVVIVLTIVVVGLAQASIAGWVDVGVDAVVGGGLIAAGALLVLGAWWGHARALIGLGMPLVAMLVVAQLIDVPLDAEADDRTIVVDSAADLGRRHELLAGHLTLDLRDLPVTVLRRDDLETLTAQVGVGEVTVLVPEIATVDLDADVRFGQLSVGPPGDVEEGFRLHRDITLDGQEDGGQVSVDVALGVGDLEVTHA